MNISETCSLLPIKWQRSDRGPFGLLILLIVGFSILPLKAAWAERAQEDALVSILQLLETDIATRTNEQDRDHAPGLVTVIEHKTMISRGDRTVSDGIRRVAGILLPDQPSVPLVRGVGGLVSDISGKIKFLLNGVSAVDVFNASANSVLDMPVDVVERIEIIRGPGAAVYGEHAFLGVVNVVTRKLDNVFIRGGSFDSARVGFNSHIESANGGQSTLNVAVSETDGPPLFVERDVLFTLGQPAVSEAPGFANTTGEQLSAIYRYQGEQIELGLQHIKSGSGDGFGARSALPPDDDRIVAEEQWTLFDLRHHTTLGEDTEFNSSAVYRRFRRHWDNAVGMPAGLFGVYTDPLTATSNEEEERYTLGLEIVSRAFDNHTILLGAEYSKSRARDVSLLLNVDQNTFIPGTPLLAPLPAPAPALLGYEDKTRSVVSAYVQDEINLGDSLDITAGLRYDDYSDIGDSTTPRLAAVWRLGEKNILKMQYGEAFRPPTFIELFNITQVRAGNENNEPEEVATTELSWIYKTPRRLFRVTAFTSSIDDLIVLDASGQFNNSRGAKSRGAEFEWEARLGDSFKLTGDLAYVDAEDRAT